MPSVLLATTLAPWPPPSIVIALVIVTVPNAPGSSASISPPAAVLDSAPAKVAHGAVRLHGLASLPTPETQVCVCAAAGLAASNPMNATASTRTYTDSCRICMAGSLLNNGPHYQIDSVHDAAVSILGKKFCGAMRVPVRGQNRQRGSIPERAAGWGWHVRFQVRAMTRVILLH